jgi:hypothetical protein
VQTHIDLKFADGEYRFALGLAQLHELQTKCKTGVGALYARVLAGRVPGQVEIGHPLYGQYHIDDLVETIRQGLIGGGEGRVDGEPVPVSAMRANDLVERYVLADGVPLADVWTFAAAVLAAKIEGYEPAIEQAVADEKKNSGDSTTTPTGDSITPPL